MSCPVSNIKYITDSRCHSQICASSHALAPERKAQSSVFASLTCLPSLPPSTRPRAMAAAKKTLCIIAGAGQGLGQARKTLSWNLVESFRNADMRTSTTPPTQWGSRSPRLTPWRYSHALPEAWKRLPRRSRTLGESYGLSFSLAAQNWDARGPSVPRSRRLTLSFLS